MKTSLLALAVAFATAAIPAAASAEPFDGPFVGIQAGGSRNEIGTVDTRIGDLAIDRSQDSFTGGAFAGYDLKVAPRIVIGGEAGLSVSTDDAIARTGTGAALRVNPRLAYDVSLRAGYLVTDNTLVYARGGYHAISARTTASQPGVTLRSSETFDGWMVGGGVERAFTDNISARVEYRYSDLDGGDGRFERHQALLGVAWRF